MPIVLTKQELERIKRWTEAGSQDADAARVQEYVNRMNQASAAMTKTWPNSLENVNKRNEEIRRARQQAAEDVNTGFYNKYIKKKKAEEHRMMCDARDAIFRNTDAPKMLLSGVVESVILKEREEQLKFNKNVVQACAGDEQKQYEYMVLQKAKEWKEMQEEKKKKRFEVNKQHQKELLDQAAEISERRRKEREEEVRMQQLDNESAMREMEALKQFQEDFKVAERARICRDNTQSIQETEQRRQEQKNREKMDELLIEVLGRSQCRVESKRRETEKRLQAEKLAILDKISQSLQHSTAERDAKEQASLEKATAAKNAAAEARHKEILEKKERQDREKREERERYLQEQEQLQRDQLTMHNFACMNRFKNKEIYDEYIKQKQDEEAARKQKYREDLRAQQKEQEEREAREKAAIRYFYGEFARKKFREADNKLFTYANALLEEARANERPTRPIYKALDRYCKLNRLYPLPDIPKSLKEHFKDYEPWDGSQLDPWYKPEVRAAPEPDEDDELLAPLPRRTDGLQDRRKPEPMKPAECAKPAAVPQADDYRRQGPANGLQRPSDSKAPDKEQGPLPPVIQMPLCKLHECICNIKGAL